MILILTPLHSQQIALLGYIQLEDKIWYVQDKGIHPDFNTSHESCITEHLKIVGNNMKTMYYLLTPDQNKAQYV